MCITQNSPHCITINSHWGQTRVSDPHTDHFSCVAASCWGSLTHMVPLAAHTVVPASPPLHHHSTYDCGRHPRQRIYYMGLVQTSVVMLTRKCK